MAETANGIDDINKGPQGVDVKKLKEQIKNDLVSIRKTIGNMEPDNIGKILQALNSLNPNELQEVSDKLKIAKVQDGVIAQKGLSDTINVLAENNSGASIEDDLRFV